LSAPCSLPAADIQH